MHFELQNECVESGPRASVCTVGGSSSSAWERVSLLLPPSQYVTHTHTHTPAKASAPIKVTLPDGTVVEGHSWKTTPYDIANGIRSAQDRTGSVTYDD